MPAISGEYKPMSLIVFAWIFKLNHPSFPVDTLPLAVKTKMCAVSLLLTQMMVSAALWLLPRGRADRSEEFRGRTIHPGPEFLGRQVVGQFRQTVEVERFFRQADAELLRIDGVNLLFDVIFDRNEK
jgi:hypothetical protein